MVKKLTERQAQVLTCLIDWVKDNQVYPTIRELMLELEIGSLRGVTVHLDALERKRYIVRKPYKDRGIAVLRNTSGNRIKFITDAVEVD
jgi:repressor LexA